MAESLKLAFKVASAERELREALSAIQRAKKDASKPHQSACLTAAIQHAANAFELLQRVSP